VELQNFIEQDKPTKPDRRIDAGVSWTTAYLLIVVLLNQYIEDGSSNKLTYVLPIQQIATSLKPIKQGKWAIWPTLNVNASASRNLFVQKRNQQGCYSSVLGQIISINLIV